MASLCILVVLIFYVNGALHVLFYVHGNILIISFKKWEGGLLINGQWKC